MGVMVRVRWGEVRGGRRSGVVVRVMGRVVLRSGGCGQGGK